MSYLSCIQTSSLLSFREHVSLARDVEAVSVEVVGLAVETGDDGLDLVWLDL